jgi:CheY-like chemotaxis protein
MRILIVEDNPVDRKLAGMLLTTSGHAVMEMASAEAAVKAIARDHYDLILLDLRLPGMDGLAFVRILRANAATRQIAIVAITADAAQFPRSTLLAAGCDACIVKPIDTRRLSRELEGVAKARAGGAQAP